MLGMRDYGALRSPMAYTQTTLEEDLIVRFPAVELSVAVKIRSG